MSSVPRVLAALLVLLFARNAFATTCTINGTVKVEPMDQYYCDPDVSGMNCSGWREVDLNDKVGGSAAPMKHMVIEVWQSSNMLWRGVTSETGSYTATFNLSGCTGQQVYIHKRFEAGYIDPPTGWLIRQFRVVGESGGVPDGSTWVDVYLKTLSGTTTTTNSLYTKTSNPSFYTQVANIYYTADSFVTATTGWSMTTPFGCLDPSDCYMIGYESFSSGNFTKPLNYSTLGAPYSVFALGGYTFGMMIRHEMAHAAVSRMFGQDQDLNCFSYNYNGNTSGSVRDANGCEWGYASTTEGLADFFGVRSITSNDNAFQCTWTNFSNEDHCSEEAVRTTEPDGGVDAFWWLSYPDYFAGIGDDWSNSTATCMNLDEPAGHCPCNASGQADGCNGTDDQDFGWRNPIQVSRFLWDLIDSNNEGGDDTDISTIALVDELEGFPCVGSLGGQDGSCEEAAASTCNPVSASASGSYGTGSRDSMNVFDIASAVAGDQGGERTLNCVQDAQD